jgi:hypothetical protein
MGSGIRVTTRPKGIQRQGLGAHLATDRLNPVKQARPIHLGYSGHFGHSSYPSQ